MKEPRRFFALCPPAGVRELIRRRSLEPLAACGGRPLPVASWHLTLAYLGPLSDADARRAAAVAADLVLPAMELRLARFGYFARPRVLWLGLSPDVPALTAFVDRLRLELTRAGLEPDRQAFHAHLSLARHVPSPAATPGIEAVVWQPRHFALLRSVPGPAGPSYACDQGFPEGSCNEP